VRQNTHDLIQHKLSAFFRYACLRSREEEIGLFRNSDPDCGKRPGITLESGPVHANHTILDIALYLVLLELALRGSPAHKRAYRDELQKWW
jgi:hypothetical protein